MKRHLVSHAFLAPIFTLLSLTSAVALGGGAASQATAGAVGTASYSAVAARLAASGTDLRRVSPLDASGRLRPRYNVTATASGYCWTSSFRNPHLYRCMKRHSIMDPCWKESGRNSVVCLLLPWSSSVTRLRLTKPLPGKDPYGGGLWGVRPGSGIRANCLVASGAGGWIGKRHINYYCGKSWVLLSQPDRTTAVWTIPSAKWVGDHYELRGRKELLVAWRAVLR